MSFDRADRVYRVYGGCRVYGVYGLHRVRVGGPRNLLNFAPCRTFVDEKYGPRIRALYFGVWGPCIPDTYPQNYIYIYMCYPPHVPTFQHGFQIEILRFAMRGGF